MSLYLTNAASLKTPGHKGAGRVGCRVCVNSGKKDLAWIAEYFPETIDLLRELEATLEAVGSPRQEAGAGSPRWFTLLISAIFI